MPDNLTVKVAVVGPGDALYFWWGHMALIIEDAAAGTSRFYDWGVFSFSADHFFTNFALGRLIYMTTESDTARALRNYQNQNRDVTMYTLDLDADAKRAIRDKAARNVLPENREYLYNHFTDNCVTQILYYIDDATNGQFRAAFENAPGRFTLRGHVRRFTWYSPFWDWILNFWMGRGIDTPTTKWQEMFLPSEAGRNIENWEYRDNTGAPRRLVSAVETVNVSHGRPGILPAPPAWWSSTLVPSLFLALFLLFLVLLRKKYSANSALRRVSCLFDAACGLFFGIAGSVLFFLTFFTNHDYAWHNINVIFVNPVFLILVPTGFAAAFTKNEKLRRRALLSRAIVWAYVFLFGMTSFAAHITRLYYQDNRATLLLLMPAALLRLLYLYCELRAAQWDSGANSPLIAESTPRGRQA